MVTLTGQIWIRSGAVLVMIGTTSARVTGKITTGGYGTNKMGGKSTSGINEEILWISLGMAITIAILISIALCYILKQKCTKRQTYGEHS